MTLHEIRVPHLSTYDFGIGVDRLSGSAMNQVVNPTPSPPTRAEGITQAFQVSRVSATRDLETALGIKIDASYGCASFGAGISARFGFAQSSEVHSSSLFMAVTASVHLADLSIDDCLLTSTAGPISRDNPTVFAARYGDMFCRACSRGGLFVGVMRVETFDDTESSKIEAELRGSYGLFSADAATNFSKVTKTHNASVYFQVYTEGGPSLNITDPTDPVQLLTAVSAWLKAMHDDGDKYSRPYEWTLSPVSIAEGPLPLNTADIEHAQDVLKFCASERAALLDQLNLLNWWRRHQERYDWTGSTTLQQVVAAAVATQNDLDTVASCASHAIDSASEAAFPAEYATKNGRPSYPTAQMPATPKTVAAAQSPAASTMWKVETIDTAGAVFPPGGYISRDYATVDSQGRLTIVGPLVGDPVSQGRVSTVQGAVFPPGGYITLPTDLSGSQILTMLAIDQQGRPTIVWTYPGQEQWQVAVVGAATFPPGGFITRPWSGDADYSLAVDNQGVLNAISARSGQQPQQAQVTAIAATALPPGAHLTMPMEAAAPNPAALSSSLGIDTNGHLNTIFVSGLQVLSQAQITTIDTPLFPPGGYISDPSPALGIWPALAIDNEGHLNMIWREPGQQPWQVSPIGAGFPPGGYVTATAMPTYKNDPSEVQWRAGVTTALAIDSQGRLNAISFRGKQRPGGALVTPISSAIFPAGGHISKFRAYLHPPGSVALAFDNQGHPNAISYGGPQPLKWETTSISSAAFPPGGYIGNVPGLAVNTRGILTRISYG